MSKLVSKSAFLTCLTGAAIWMTGCQQETVTPPPADGELEVEHGEHGHAHDEAGHTHAEPPVPTDAEPASEDSAAAEPAPPADSPEGGSTLEFGDL